MQSTEPKSTTDIALGIICDDDRVLVGKRDKNLSQGGYLEFPGGKLEEGESFYDALIREVYEETQIEVLQPLLDDHFYF